MQTGEGMRLGRFARMSFAAAAVSMVAAPIVVPRTARAGAQVDPLAIKKFDQGKDAYDKKNFSTALAAFSMSLDLLPSPNTRLYIGRCQRELGLIASASASLKLAAREAKDRLATSGEKRFAATEVAATKEAEDLEPRVPHILIKLPSPVPGSLVVLINNKAVPLTTLESPVELDPGKYAILVSAPGHAEFSSNLVVVESDNRTVDVALNRVAAARLSLRFTTKPSGLSVKLDGKPVEPTELAKPFSVAPGEHVVMVQAPGHDDFIWKGTSKDLDDTTIDVKLSASVSALDPTARTGPAPWMTFAAGGVGLVAVGVGTVFALQARSVSDAEQAKPVPERTKDERDRIGSLSVRANVLFLGGGVLLVGAGILAATTQWSRPEKSVAMVPVVGPGFLGAAWEGRF